MILANKKKKEFRQKTRVFVGKNISNIYGFKIFAVFVFLIPFLSVFFIYKTKRFKIFNCNES